MKLKQLIDMMFIKYNIALRCPYNVHVPIDPISLENIHEASP